MPRNKKRQPDPIPIVIPQQNLDMANKISISVDTLLNSLQNYEGKPNQDITYFISQFNEIANAAKIPNELKLIFLKSKLSGAAQDMMINTPTLRDENNYDEFIRKLRQQFKTEKSFAQAQENFLQAKQSPTQSVEDFTKNFKIAAQKYLSISGHAAKDGAREFLDTIKLSKFIEGLRADISFEMQKFPPDNFEDAVTMAKQLEVALNNKKSFEINNMEAQNESPIYKAIIQLSNTQTQQMKELKDQVNALQKNDTQKQADPININEIQEQVNSIRITNTQDQIQENQSKTFCHICQKSNHETQNCFYNAKSTAHRMFTPRNTRFSGPRYYTNYYRNTPRFPSNNWNAPRHFSQFPHTQQQYHSQNFIPRNSNQEYNFPIQNHMQNWDTNTYQAPMPQINSQNWNYNTQTAFNPSATAGNTQQLVWPRQNLLQAENQTTQQTATMQITEPTVTFPNESNQNNNNNRQNKQRSRKRPLNY